MKTIQFVTLTFLLVFATVMQAQDIHNPYDNCECTDRMERDHVFGGSIIVTYKGVRYMFYDYYKPEKNTCFQNYLNESSSITVEAFKEKLLEHPTFKMLVDAGVVRQKSIVGKIYWKASSVSEVEEAQKEKAMEYNYSNLTLKAIDLNVDFETPFSKFKTCSN